MGIRAQGNPLASFLDVWSRSGTDASGPNARPSSTTATGGVISDYTDPGPGKVYRAHIFTSSGTFDVTALSNTYPADIDYLVVAGGGGGGEFNTNRGGGGGAGGLRSNFPTIPAPFKTPSFPVSVQPYTITVGAGGVGAVQSGTGYINPGSNSSIGSAVVASGGGGGGNRTDDPAPGNYPDSPEMAGGSGGGGGSGPGGGTGGPTVNSPDPLTPQAQGFAGGDGDGNPPNYGAGGGGGAGAVGSDGTTIQSGAGGNGLQVLIAGTPASIQPVGTPGTNPGGGYFAGGGGGGNYNDPTPTAGAPGGEGGGGQGGSGTSVDGVAGTVNTGGGGGGNKGRSGGSGIVAVRYQIGTTAPAAKATGGSISFYNSKWIHTFVNSGTFVNPSSISNVEVVMVAGGGSGGLNIGGGGGAGAVLESPGTGFTFPNNTYTITIGAGGAGKTSLGPATANTANDTTISYPGPYTWTAQRGGYGATYPDVAAQPGGSGGGGSSNPQPAAGTATAADSPTPIGTLTAYGNAGGASSGNFEGAGGGGAGAAASSNPTSGVGGPGAVGRQLPATFRDPRQAPSDSSNPQPYQRGGGLGTPGPAGSYYVAAGGGGSAYPGNTPGNRGLGGAGGGGDGGFHDQSPPNTDGQSALVNTGSGGGGSGYSHPGSGSSPSTSGSGGSGIVLIAYPD